MSDVNAAEAPADRRGPHRFSTKRVIVWGSASIALVLLGGLVYTALLQPSVLLEADAEAGRDNAVVAWPLRAEYANVARDQERGRELIVRRRFEASSWDAWSDTVVAVSGVTEAAAASPMLAPGTRQTFSTTEGWRVEYPDSTVRHEEHDGEGNPVPTLFFGPAVATVPEGREPTESRLEDQRDAVARRLGLPVDQIDATASVRTSACEREQPGCANGQTRVVVDALYVRDLNVPLLVEVTNSRGLIERIEVTSITFR